MRLIKPAYTLFLKTGPSCNAGCPSCPSGERRDIEKIPLMTDVMYARIVDRIFEQNVKIISTILHYYNEPTLNPHMPEIIKLGKRRGILTVMSTNGSYPENLAKCMEAGLDNLIFSISGFTQEIHERSHKYTDIEKIKQNMISVSKNLKAGQFVRVGWHDYAYNEHEKELMREFTESLGFKFTSYYTSVLPLDIPLQAFEIVQQRKEWIPTPAERDIRTPLSQAAKMCKERRHFKCVYQHRMVTIDSRGFLYNCAAKIGEHNR